MMEAFFVRVLLKVLQDERVQNWIKNMITVAASSAAATAVDKVVEKIPGVEAVIDVVDVASDVRTDLDKLIPDFDTGIKPLDDLMDIWRPHG